VTTQSYEKGLMRWEFGEKEWRKMSERQKGER